MTFAADIVRLLHLALIAFVVCVPFITEGAHWGIYAIHCMTVITLLVHWWTNESTCCLTLLESMLRGIPTERSFMHSLVNPIYRIDDVSLKRLVQLVTPLLGLISASHLSSNWNLIKRDVSLVLHQKNLVGAKTT